MANLQTERISKRELYTGGLKMNTVLYLVGQADKTISYNEFFETLTIMNESDLREFLKEEIEQGHIAKQNMEDHNIEKPEDCFEADINDIFGTFCDNVDYDINNDYYISQQEVEVNNEDMYD